MKTRGFTLIELLVVIAIIGILSSVALASLNSSRDRSKNAAIKAALNQLQRQAFIYYEDNNGTYGSIGTNAGNNICLTTAATFFADSKIRSMISNAQSNGGGNAGCVALPLSNPTSYAVSIDLKTSEGSNTKWCVDSLGNAKGTSAATSPTVSGTCP